jgi:tRNA threonylcarbamoyladenosine biosynthesis protein TsaB
MVRILSLETSTTVCSVALHENGSLLAVAEVHLEHSHGSKLAQLIDAVVKFSGFGMADITAVAVSSGPGSYTGLRIGTSTAKGICFSLNVPLIAVDTLAILSEQVNRTNIERSLLCPMIDARRMEVFTALYTGDVKEIKPPVALVLNENSFEEELKSNSICFFGNGSVKFLNLCKNPNAVFKTIVSGAADMIMLSEKKFNARDFADLAYSEPLYLKEFYTPPK